MFERNKFKDPATAAAFLKDERAKRVESGKIASLLVMVLMPLGLVADLFVYEQAPEKVHWQNFLVYRLLCSVLAGGLYLLHRGPFGAKHFRVLGLPIVMLPAFFMNLIIARASDPIMPYYAGLSLIMLAVSVVGRWNLFESFLAVVSVLIMYCVVCLTLEHPQREYIFNNLYFLVLTGVIVMVGNQLFDELRRKEFEARYELENSKLQLERQKVELEEKTVALEEKTTDLAKTVTDLHAAQAELVEADRARTQARLGGFIVHNIGNALNYPINSVFRLRKRIKTLSDETRPDFETAVSSVDSGLKAIKETIEAMRLLAYPDTKSIDTVKVSEVVRLSVLLTDYRWLDEGVEIHQDLAPGLSIRANKQLVIDGIINLILNSLDAMKEKQFAENEKRGIWITACQENASVVIRLRDNGPGISPEHQDKVFERNFTTKAAGHGTGLGLASCRETVECFGGTIRLRTQVGSFCEFTLAFPLEG
jgi:signal transduction histidine kinase